MKLACQPLSLRLTVAAATRSRSLTGRNNVLAPSLCRPPLPFLLVPGSNAPSRRQPTNQRVIPTPAGSPLGAIDAPLVVFAAPSSGSLIFRIAPRSEIELLLWCARVYIPSSRLLLLLLLLCWSFFAATAGTRGRRASAAACTYTALEGLSADTFKCGGQWCVLLLLLLL